MVLPPTRESTIMDKNIAVAILMGGKSRRMGIRKDTVRLESGETFLQRICRECAGYKERVISVNAMQHDIDNFAQRHGYKVIEDIYDDYGPMGGIISVLSGIESNAVLIVAVDMINIKREHIDSLLSCYNGEKILTAVSGSGTEPLFSIYSKECLPDFQKAVSSGNYSLRKFIENISNRKIYFDNDEIFENINTYNGR